MKYILILMIIVITSIYADAQTVCDAGSHCVRQETIDKCAQTADELIATRDALAKSLAQNAFSDQERALAIRVHAAYDKLVATQDSIIVELKEINALYKEAVLLLQEINKSLLERLSKPKSAFSKFVDALKTVVTVAAGIVIGRGL